MPENPKSPRDQFVDDVLDAALRNYGRAEPLAGIENRVLRRLEQDPPKSFWLTGWHWSAMGAVGTLAVVALALITYPPEVRLPRPSYAPATQQPGAAAPTDPGSRFLGGPVAVPAPNRTPRFNKTIQQSGVRSGSSGVRPLPPCTPEQQAALKKKQAEQKNEAKTSQDCVSVSQQHPSQARPPRH
jgi:hypothetical protein